jgi:predicted amino acid-binding ACT domain protein
MNTAILLVDCPDRKGLVATISQFLYEHGANIIHADQHRDNAAGLFFMRVEWALEEFDLDPPELAARFSSTRRGGPPSPSSFPVTCTASPTCSIAGRPGNWTARSRWW